MGAATKDDDAAAATNEQTPLIQEQRRGTFTWRVTRHSLLLGVLWVVLLLGAFTYFGGPTDVAAGECDGGGPNWFLYRFSDMFTNSGILGGSKMFEERRRDQPDVCVPSKDVFRDRDSQLGCLAWWGCARAQS